MNMLQFTSPKPSGIAWHDSARKRHHYCTTIMSVPHYECSQIHTLVAWDALGLVYRQRPRFAASFSQHLLHQMAPEYKQSAAG